MMADVIIKTKNNFYSLPTVHQCKSLSCNDSQCIRNESVNWLTKKNAKLSLWGHTKSPKCTQPSTGNAPDKKENSEADKSREFLSIFGSSSHQINYTNKMENMKNYQLLSCLYALFAAAKNQEWSQNLLDIITTTAVIEYPRLLKELSIMDKQFNIGNLSKLYNFNDFLFEVKLQHVATGYLNIPDGVNESNLTKALNSFFRSQQFGLFRHCNRTLAFGYTKTDNKNCFFIYDCQNQGYPMFEDQNANSCVSIAHSLPNLVNCFMVTLNVSTKMTQFFMYNADIRILNSLKSRRKILFENISNIKVGESCPNGGSANISNFVKEKKAFKRHKNLDKNNENTKISKKVDWQTGNYERKLTLDPDKMYYIIAVPNNPAKIGPGPKVKKKISTANPPKNIKVNVHRIKTTKSQTKNCVTQHIHTTSYNLKDTASTCTLTPNTVTESGINNTSTEGLEIYLVNKSYRSKTNTVNASHKIKIAQKIRDLFKKNY